MQNNDRTMVSAMIEKKDLATLLVWYAEQGLRTESLSVILRDVLKVKVQELVEEQGAYKVDTIEEADFVIESRKNSSYISILAQKLKESREKQENE